MSLLSGHLRTPYPEQEVWLEKWIMDSAPELDAAAVYCAGQFIRLCLRLDPVQRPSVEELAKHPWVKEHLYIVETEAHLAQM